MQQLRLLALPAVCALLSAITFVVAKYVGFAMSAVPFSFFRMVLTVLVMVPFIKRADLQKITRANLGMQIVAGLVGFTLNNYFFFRAFDFTSALNVSLINVLTPLLTLLVSALFLKKIPTKRQLSAFIIAFFGVALILLDGTGDKQQVVKEGFGELMALLGSSTWVIYMLMVQQLGATFSSAFLTFSGAFFGAIFMMPFFLLGYDFWQIVSAADLSSWLAIAYISTFGTGALYLLYLKSVMYIGPSMTAFVVYSMRPVIVAVLSYWVLAAGTSSWQIIGGLLVVFALGLGLWRSPGQMNEQL